MKVCQERVNYIILINYILISHLGVRLMVGLRTLTPPVEVRVLYPQPK
jgi:hypothetical protein